MRDTEKEERSSYSNERKRDGSALGEDSTSDRASKRGMFSSTTACGAPITSSPTSPHFPSPSPVLITKTVRESSRERTRPARTRNRSRSKEGDKMKMEDY